MFHDNKNKHRIPIKMIQCKIMVDFKIQKNKPLQFMIKDKENKKKHTQKEKKKSRIFLWVQLDSHHILFSHLGL